MELSKLVKDITDKSSDIVFPTNGWEGRNFINTDPYHKWLAAYIRDVSPKRCLELGRRNGNSLYSMSYFLPDKSILDSYDLNMGGNIVDKENVNVLEYDGDFSVIDFGIYDFIFVDINGSGSVEYQVYMQMLDNGFKGISCWDDIGTKWCPNHLFWDMVETDKFASDLHGKENFGVIRHI